MAQAVEANAAAIVTQHLQATYQDAVRTLDQRLRKVADALQPVRTLHALAREQFTRTVLPHVEPLACALRPGQSVGIEELLWIFDHDKDVQALLADSE